MALRTFKVLAIVLIEYIIQTSVIIWKLTVEVFYGIFHHRNNITHLLLVVKGYLPFIFCCFKSHSQEEVFGISAPWNPEKLTGTTPSPSPRATPPRDSPDFIVAPSGGNYTTIGDAYAAANCGDLIQVKNGTYTLTSTLNLNKTCTDSMPITIQNYPGHSPVVTCSNPTYGFNRVEFNGQWTIWDGIEVNGCYDGVKLYKGNNTVKNSKIHHNLYQGILIAVTTAELSNIVIENNEIYRNGYAEGTHTVSCNDSSWNPTPPYNSPKHCHGVYISDFGCNGTNNINITNNYIHDHGGRGVQWNGQGCSSHMKNTLVTGNTFENNSVNIILWYNVRGADISNNTFILNSVPQTDDTSHGQFGIQTSSHNEIKHNIFSSNNPNLQNMQTWDSTSVNNDVNYNSWAISSQWWKWKGSWRKDFRKEYQKLTGWDKNGIVKYIR